MMEKNLKKNVCVCVYIYEYEIFCCKPKTNKTVQIKKKSKCSANPECDSTYHSKVQNLTRVLVYRP